LLPLRYHTRNYRNFPYRFSCHLLTCYAEDRLAFGYNEEFQSWATPRPGGNFRTRPSCRAGVLNHHPLGFTVDHRVPNTIPSAASASAPSITTAKLAFNFLGEVSIVPSQGSFFAKLTKFVSLPDPARRPGLTRVPKSLNLIMALFCDTISVGVQGGPV
jgi:hypothetical protein